MAETKIDLSQYVGVLQRWWKTGITIVVIVVLLSVLVILLTDDVYVAQASLLPQIDPAQSAAGASSIIAGQMGGLGAFLPGMATPTDIVIAMLRSRTIAGWVVDKMNLSEAWGIEGENKNRVRERTISVLKSKTLALMDEHGMIELRVSDADPQRAADIVNSYVDELDRANMEFNTSNAADTRVFIETRLIDTQEKLAETQARLREFQETHGALAIEEQTRATVELIAGLQRDVELLRAQRDVLREFHSGDSNQISSLSGQITALESRIQVLSKGSTDVGDSTGVGVLLELSAVPALTVEYTRLRLAVETQGEVYAMLSKEYELARIEEKRQTPTIRVLDRGTPPLFKARPRPKLYLVLGFMLGCGVAFLAVLLLDRLAPAGESESERIRGLLRRRPAFGQA